MKSTDVRDWFATYLETFAAFGRGDRTDMEDLRQYYDVPLLLTTDRGALALDSEDSVARALTEQIDGMRAAGYERSELLESRVELLNAVTALYHGHFSRRTSDGSEIGRVRVTYVITDRGTDRRIGALIVHSAW
jgi:hypothetical protein